MALCTVSIGVAIFLVYHCLHLLVYVYNACFPLVADVFCHSFVAHDPLGDGGGDRCKNA